MREQRGLTSFRTDSLAVSSPAFPLLRRAVGKGMVLSLQRSRVQSCMGHLASYWRRWGSETCLSAVAGTSKCLQRVAQERETEITIVISQCVPCTRHYSRCIQGHLHNLATEFICASVFLSVKWRYNYYSYFTDEERGTEKFNYFPKVA